MDYLINNQSDFDTYKNSPFAPGDRILFKRGSNFNGQFAPKGSGVNGNPIIIDTHDSGDLPLLQGNGIVDGVSNATLYLYNQEYWEINNLEITNTDGSDNDQGDLRGIYVVGDNGTTLNHIYIRNCYIHNVNGNVAGKLRGGIHLHVNGTAPTKFNDVQIENNSIENAGGVGIGNQSSRRNRFEVDDGDGDWLPWTSYVIRNNWINNTGRNCVIVRVSEQAVVEYNTFANSSRYSTGHSIFCFNTDNCMIQYNEGYGNSGNVNEVDRGSFDADWNCRNTRIQYNYSHDNNFSVGIMRRYNSRFKIRYNISQNENYAIFFYGFDQSTDSIDSGDIYNNTIFFNSNGEIFEKNAPGGGPIDTRFWNNIFYFGNSGDWGRIPDSTNLFQNNCYYNFTGGSLGSGAITTNPMLVNPGTGGQGIDMHNPNRLAGYKLKANSPCIDSGINVSFNGGKDFWGNPLYNGSLPDIGANEFSGGSPITGTKKTYLSPRNKSCFSSSWKH